MRPLVAKFVRFMYTYFGKLKKISTKVTGSEVQATFKCINLLWIYIIFTNIVLRQENEVFVKLERYFNNIFYDSRIHINHLLPASKIYLFILLFDKHESGLFEIQNERKTWKLFASTSFLHTLSDTILFSYIWIYTLMAWC